MYRATVICTGLSDSEGSQAAKDILEGFAERPWHQDVQCEWTGSVLRLFATNDFDPIGDALLDEFTDEVFANVNFKGTIRTSVESVTEL